MDLEMRLRGILPKAQHKKIEAIMDACQEVLTVNEVAPHRTHAVVQSEVRAYGLILGIDANGEAATVQFPYGAEVTTW